MTGTCASVAPMLTLSFDNGPDTAVTPRVLDDLAARDLTATFFVVGERLEDPARRALLDRIAAEGHALGNHTWSHPRPFVSLPHAEVVDEIERTDAAMGDHASPLFRPSGRGGLLEPGLLTRPLVDHLAATGRTLVLWNSVPRDWERPDGSWIELARADMEAQDHTLIVLHDIPTGAMDHLGRFLDEVLEAGIGITPDLPAAAVPVREGRQVVDVDHLM